MSTNHQRGGGERVTTTGGTRYNSAQSDFLYYYHPDHLGSTGFVTDQNGELYEHMEYFPFGESWVQEHSNTQRTPYLYTGKELDEETQLYYYGARYYDPRTSVWQSADPIIGKYLDGKSGMGGVFNTFNLSLYAYTHLNPVKLLDPDGNEPVKSQAGNIDDFVNAMNTSPSKVGLKQGNAAATTLKNFSSVGFFDNKPNTLGRLGQAKGRYTYTAKGGWLDMYHFLHFAGRAYAEKLDGNANAIADTIRSGDLQEMVDPAYSGYSYEDLPSDAYGADFAVNHFDPNSSMTLGGQIKAYMNDVLGAESDPRTAPNFNKMLDTHEQLKAEVLSGKYKPMRNYGTAPQHTTGEPYVVRD